MDALTTAFRDSQNGVGASAQAQQAGNFRKWREYTESIGIKDCWLDSFPGHIKPLIVGGFVSALRQNRFGKKAQPLLLHSTIKGALSSIRTEFRKNMRGDPACGGVGEGTSIFIQRQLRGFEDSDPAPKQAKALPLSVFKLISCCTFSPKQIAVSQLVLCAFFLLCDPASMFGRSGWGNEAIVRSER